MSRLSLRMLVLYNDANGTRLAYYDEDSKAAKEEKKSKETQHQQRLIELNRKVFCSLCWGCCSANDNISFNLSSSSRWGKCTPWWCCCCCQTIETAYRHASTSSAHAYISHHNNQFLRFKKRVWVSVWLTEAVHSLVCRWNGWKMVVREAAI